MWKVLKGIPVHRAIPELPGAQEQRGTLEIKVILV